MTPENAASRSRGPLDLTPENAGLLAQSGSGRARRNPAIGRLGLWSAVRGKAVDGGLGVGGGCPGRPLSRPARGPHGQHGGS
jgi:hypothetical protein